MVDWNYFMDIMEKISCACGTLQGSYSLGVGVGEECICECISTAKVVMHMSLETRLQGGLEALVQRNNYSATALLESLETAQPRQKKVDLIWKCLNSPEKRHWEIHLRPHVHQTCLQQSLLLRLYCHFAMGSTSEK